MYQKSRTLTRSNKYASLLTGALRPVFLSYLWQISIPWQRMMVNSVLMILTQIYLPLLQLIDTKKSGLEREMGEERKTRDCDGYSDPCFRFPGTGSRYSDSSTSSTRR